jgi:hypothetical protein
MLSSRLIVPEMAASSTCRARLLKLAEFSGIACESPPLEHILGARGRHRRRSACLALDAHVARALRRVAPEAGELKAVLDGWSAILLCGLEPDADSVWLLREISCGRLVAIEPVKATGQYRFTAGRSACGPFAGLSATANAPGQHVFRGEFRGLELLVAHDRGAVLTVDDHGPTRVAFLGGAPIADLDLPVEKLDLAPHVDTLAVPLIALRWISGDACWHPLQVGATLIIDDPLLLRRFGFLHYGRALELMDSAGFHTAIAFIPYNYGRSRKDVADIFRSRSDRLSLCYHGNDHMDSELTARDIPLLNAMLGTAAWRMERHRLRTGIVHDDVMVFPKGGFSREAMIALRANNFAAAVNSGGYPPGEPVVFTLRELAAPAVMKFEGFPLFFRRYVREWPDTEIAFHRLLGKPVLLGEHHDVFREPDALRDLAARVRAVAPDVRWAGVQRAVEQASLYRRTSEGAVRIRVHAARAVLRNPDDDAHPVMVERQEFYPAAIERVEIDGRACDYAIAGQWLQVMCDVPPGGSRHLRVTYRNELGTSRELGSWRRRLRVYARRRLSEARDVHLSRHSHVLQAVGALRKMLGRTGVWSR